MENVKYTTLYLLIQELNIFSCSSLSLKLNDCSHRRSASLSIIETDRQEYYHSWPNLLSHPVL